MLRDSRSGARSLRNIPRAAIGVIGMAAAASLALGACSSDSSSSGDGGGDGCLSNRAFFEKEVWSPFMEHQCGTCHADGGKAIAQGAQFQLQTTSYPGFVDANLANITMLSKKIDFSSKESYLLLKPLGKLNHGGGVQLQADSDNYKNLEALVKRVQDNDDSCTDTANTTIAAVKSLDSATTLRKAALDLAGRLPTKAETDKVTKGGDAALDETLDAIMTEDIFYTRLQEIWNDLLLVNKYANNNQAINFMNGDEYPTIAKDYNNNNNDPDADLVNLAIAQEPLNLITYVVKNNKPFTDIAQADYTVVNPFLAKAYGVSVGFKNSKDYNEWHEAKVTLGTGVALPHAGILSTPVFLNRWTTTPTNRNRGRARRVFLYLLATDVLKIADRPVDATAVAKVDNPTMNSALCFICHKQIDPIAGGFRGYDDFDYELFDPKSDSAVNWHPDMAESGFEGKNMPSSYYTHALQWLGQQVAADSRFQINAVRTTFTGLTGQDPLVYPEDNTVPTFNDDLAAWTAQDKFFRDTASAFAAAKFNLKTVVKAIVKSPYYRGLSGPAHASPALMAGIGTGRMLTPEMLDRKITAIMGFPWTSNYDPTRNYLRNDFYITYGGIDSDSVITRLTTPNGLLFAVQQRMANEVACSATAFDFTKAKDQRTLFPLVDVDETPESAGHAVSGSVDDIKDNIVYLFGQLLGQKVSRGDLEVERAYQLYLDTYHEVSESGDQGLPCQGRNDPKTGAQVPDAQAIMGDPNFTIRPWQAVITYLLSDYSFLYE